MKPSLVPRSSILRLVGSALCALALTAGAAAQSEPAGQRSGSAASPAAQGRSSSPARASSPPRATAPATPEAGQPRVRSSSPKPKDAAAEPAAGNSVGKAAGKNSTGKPAAGKATPAKPSAAPAGAPGGSQAALLATFDDWGAYATPAGRSRVCYALSQPSERMPKTATRDPAYLFVSFRPSENIRNEVALVMGFPTKDGGEAQATIGTATYDLVTKGPNAWVKNPAEEGQVIRTMSRASSVTVKAVSGRGNPMTDRYSLKGFAKALEKAREECKQGSGA